MTLSLYCLQGSFFLQIIFVNSSRNSVFIGYLSILLKYMISLKWPPFLYCVMIPIKAYSYSSTSHVIIICSKSHLRIKYGFISWSSSPWNMESKSSFNSHWVIYNITCMTNHSYLIKNEGKTILRHDMFIWYQSI